MKTNREIAIMADIHGLLEPLESVLLDIKKRGIREIYSLGDNIGIGPSPKEVLHLLKENKERKVEKIPTNLEDKKKLWRSLCNIRDAKPISKEYLQIEKEYLRGRIKK